MITIIKFRPLSPITDNGSELIESWIIAKDILDARRIAQRTGDMDLYGDLMVIHDPSAGKHELWHGHTMLVGETSQNPDLM